VGGPQGETLALRDGFEREWARRTTRASHDAAHLQTVSVRGAGWQKRQ
jgi:hypothetical protein